MKTTRSTTLALAVLATGRLARTSCLALERRSISQGEVVQRERLTSNGDHGIGQPQLDALGSVGDLVAVADGRSNLPSEHLPLLRR